MYHADVYKRQELYPDAMTVFVGPCMAKKKEAREEDIADAVDYVLTLYKETVVVAFLKPSSGRM